jgi:multiple sugar transport system substrate-binding protein
MGALAGTAALSACAAATPQVVEKEVTVEVEKVVKETVEASPTPVAEPVNLTLLMVDWNEDCRTLYEQEILPKFQEQHPGWTVTADWTSWADLDVKVMTAFAGGLQPDVFQADNVEFGPKYNQKGIIAELNPFIEGDPDARAKIDDYYPKALYEGATIAGKIVALPYVLDNRALFYRKDFFTEVGLSPDVPPATWDDFRAAAIKLTKRTDDTFERAGWHSDLGWTCFQTYVQLLWQNGGELLDEAHERCAFNSPEGVEALELWVRLIREDRVGPVEDMPSIGDLSPFTAGSLAMVFAGYGQLLNAQKYKPEVVDSTGITVLGEKQPAALWYANTFFLSKGKRLSQAWELLKWLVLDDGNFRRYHEATGGLPPRKSITASANHITSLHRILIEDVMNAPGSHTTPAEPFSLEVLERVSEACQKAVYGTTTAKEALETAAQEGNQIIARYLGS